MRILSELVFIPQTQESIGCCMTFPDFYFLPRAVVFNIQPDVERLVGVKCKFCYFMLVKSNSSYQNVLVCSKNRFFLCQGPYLVYFV